MDGIVALTVTESTAFNDARLRYHDKLYGHLSLFQVAPGGWLLFLLASKICKCLN